MLFDAVGVDGHSTSAQTPIRINLGDEMQWVAVGCYGTLWFQGPIASSRDAGRTQCVYPDVGV